MTVLHTASKWFEVNRLELNLDFAINVSSEWSHVRSVKFLIKRAFLLMTCNDKSELKRNLKGTWIFPRFNLDLFLLRFHLGQSYQCHFNYDNYDIQRD